MSARTPQGRDTDGEAWYATALARMGDDAGVWTSSNEAVVTEPYRYLEAHPGKEVRTRLIDAFNEWLRVPRDALDQVTSVVRRLHTASLLMDDVEDNSDLRRRVPTAHTIYGVPQTINSANYIYFCVFADIARFAPVQATDVMRLLSDELVRLHRGQGMDLFWRESLLCPSENEYVDMVTNKTGGLFRIAIKLMRALSASPPDADLVPLVNLIGLYFQIRDDYMNLQSAQLIENKGFCEDLTEGKFSFPVIHSIHSAQEDRTLMHILRQRTQNIATKQFALEYMDRVTNSFAYTRSVLTSLGAQARGEVRRLETLLGENSKLHAILDALEAPCAAALQSEQHVT